VYFISVNKFITIHASHYSLLCTIKNFLSNLTCIDNF